MFLTIVPLKSRFCPIYYLYAVGRCYFYENVKYVFLNCTSQVLVLSYIINMM